MEIEVDVELQSPHPARSAWLQVLVEEEDGTRQDVHRRGHVEIDAATCGAEHVLTRLEIPREMDSIDHRHIDRRREPPREDARALLLALRSSAAMR